MIPTDKTEFQLNFFTDWVKWAAEISANLHSKMQMQAYANVTEHRV